MNELRPKLFDVMKSYTKKQLIKDIISGIIVAIIALPSQSHSQLLPVSDQSRDFTPRSLPVSLSLSSEGAVYRLADRPLHSLLLFTELLPVMEPTV